MTFPREVDLKTNLYIQEVKIEAESYNMLIIMRFLGKTGRDLSFKRCGIESDAGKFGAVS